MNKKSLLFVLSNLGCGGAEKSLVTLLNCIDYSKFEVDLFLFEQVGELMSMLPPEVNLLKSSGYWTVLNQPFKTSVRILFKDKRPDLIFCRIMQGVVCKKYKLPEQSEQKLWKYIKQSFLQLPKIYDVAIGFLEKNPVYFIVDKVKAKKKIGWIHTNYEKLQVNARQEKKYFNELDFLVTVSEECAKVLMDLFPSESTKVRVIENIMDPCLIRKKAEEEGGQDSKTLKIVTVARLSLPKGIDLALDACRFLVKDGYKFTWSIIGDGLLRGELENSIRKYGLEGVFLLEGVKENPYTYMKNATIYVQPSRYEGKSIAIEEAKILNKPIVVTNYATVKDQIKHDVNGLIVDMKPEGIYSGIKMLINNISLRERLSRNLGKEDHENLNEINKLYELF